MFLQVWSYSSQLVSNWHAFTFDAETPAGPSILKITQSSHRTSDQLEAEIDWMLFLVSQGVGDGGQAGWVVVWTYSWG